MLPKEVLTAKNKTQIMDQEVKKGQATVQSNKKKQNRKYETKDNNVKSNR